MELVLTNQDVKPLPKRVKEIDLSVEGEGLLNSNYKRLVKNNLNSLNTNSVFAKRQLVKNRHYYFTPNIETVLKLSVFVTVFSIIFS